jgi:hypothetical protein
MKSRRTPLFALALALLALPVAAQQDEEGRFGLGLGAGMVETGDGAEPYLTANLRRRLGYDPDGAEAESAVSGFVEPEVGYWSSEDATGVDRTDLLVGANIGAAMRLRVVEYFVAAGLGWHFLDTEINRAGGSVEVDQKDSLGFNAQFGFDVRVSELMSLFGVGRFDLIDEAAEQEQAKAYLGLRFRF